MATAKEYSVEEKLAALLNLQKVESKLDAIAILVSIKLISSKKTLDFSLSFYI